MTGGRRLSILGAWGFILFFLITFVQAASRNITIPTTSSQVVYTPFVCNASSTLTNPQCLGAWQITDLAGTNVVRTNGPDPDAANIIPQMFFSFRASAFYLETSNVSTAEANITVSENLTSIEVNFNSSIGTLAVVNLVETEVTLVTLTFLPDQFPSRLDIQSLIITVDDGAPSSSILPTMTLPPSMTLPTIITPTRSSTSSTLTMSPSTSPAAAAQTSPNRKMLAMALGLTIGLGLGLTLIAVGMFYYWRRRRRRQAQVEAAANGFQYANRPPNKMWF